MRTKWTLWTGVFWTMKWTTMRSKKRAYAEEEVRKLLAAEEAALDELRAKTYVFVDGGTIGFVIG